MKQILILLIAGCLTAGFGLASILQPPSSSPSNGNTPTYSGNGKGEQDAEIIKQCAFMAAAQDPSLNRDALFVLCLDENGVWSI